MNPTWGILIALVYVAIQVFSYLAKESAKRKERERKMEEAERRRIATARMEPPTPVGESRVGAIQNVGLQVTAGTPPSQPTPIRMGRSVEDLAAQRMKQIEMLRSRAAARPGQGSASSLPISRSPGSPPTAPGTGQRISTRQQPEPAGRAQQQRSIAEREARAARQRELAARAKRQQEQARQQADERKRSTEPERTTQSDRPSPLTPVGAPAGNKGLHFRSRLKNRAALRDLIIFREIIDQPISIRAQ